MGYFVPHVLANILRREIIVRDLTNNCDFVNIVEAYLAIDSSKISKTPDRAAVDDQ